MSLREYAQLLRDGKWWIATGLLLGMLGGQLFALTSPVSYVATTTLYFSAIEGGGEPGQAYQGALLAEQKARAYSQLILNDRVLDEVAFDTGAPVAASAITVQSTAGNPTLTVKVSDASAERAENVANVLADKSANLVSELERPRDPILSTVVTLRVLAPADVRQVAPNLGIDLLVGAAIGTLLGLSVALIRRTLDGSVRTRQQLDDLTGLPLLGSVPYDRPSRVSPTLITAHPRGPVAESVRQLRVALRSAGAATSCTSLLVTSAVAGEGKTSLACDLAAAFGLEGERVLLVDADLRAPAVGRYLGIESGQGLSSVLRGECEAADAIESAGNGLFDVLASGPAPENPSELLGSISPMLGELGSRYDVVVVDSPALLPVADARVLARATDAVLLVVRHSRTPAAEVAEALAALRALAANVLGCAFSMEPRSRVADYAPVPAREASADGVAMPEAVAEYPASGVPHSPGADRSV